MSSRPQISLWLWLLQRAFALVVSGTLTLAVFLVLPFMQAIGGAPDQDLMIRQVAVTDLVPPPAPPEEEPPQEKPEPEPPPELAEPVAPLDLGQLELSLNPGFGDGLFGEFTIKVAEQIAGGDEDAMNQVFSLADLDQRPRVLFQKVPEYPSDLRRRQATVYLVFLVDRQGKVADAKVDKSTDPAFDRHALEAVRQWRFEPGTRKGEKVSFKMRIPITFNAS